MVMAMAWVATTPWRVFEWGALMDTTNGPVAPKNIVKMAASTPFRNTTGFAVFPNFGLGIQVITRMKRPRESAKGFPALPGSADRQTLYQAHCPLQTTPVSKALHCAIATWRARHLSQVVRHHEQVPARSAACPAP